MVPNYAWWAVSYSDAYGNGSMNSTRITRISSDGSVGVPGWYTTPRAPWQLDYPYGPFGNWEPKFIGSDDKLYALQSRREGNDFRIIVRRTPLLEVAGVLRSEVVLDTVVAGLDETVYQVGSVDWYANMYWDAGLVVRVTATRPFSPPNLGWLTTVMTETVRESGGSRAYMVSDTRADGVYEYPSYREEGALVRFEDGAVAFVESGVWIPQ